jgi:ABC-type lipoprotein export system ATPase subunit
MIEIKDLSKVYISKGKEVKALDHISLNIENGEFIVIRGASGSGKTTLLLVIGAMLKPSSGKLLFDEQDIYNLSVTERNEFRASKVGFVFQMFHLLPYLTLLENVNVMSLGQKNVEAEKMLVDLGLGDRMHHKPNALSAGEKQRGAVSRALINHPKIILADEPTGNLDPENAEEVLKSFVQFHKNGGTVIVVTHGKEADKYADRIISLKNGKIVI